MPLSQTITINTIPASNKLYAVKYYEGATFPLPFHNHNHFELTLILQGSGTRFIGDSVEEFAEGEVILIGPHLPHQWHVNDSHPQQQLVKAISVFFEEDFPSKDFNLIGEMEAIRDLKEKTSYGVRLFGEVLNKVATQIESLVHLNGLETLIKILSILEQIATSHQYTTLSSLKMKASSDVSNMRVRQITNHIKANLHRRITLEELAEVACLHKGSIGRFFKQSVGFTPIEYVNLLRIGKSCEQLISSNQKVSAIALNCGFDNLSHFNRLFKKIKGLTPLAYRERKFAVQEGGRF